MERNEVLDNFFIYKHRDEIIKYLKPYMKKGHYNIIKLLEMGCTYNLIFGTKSNGKSTACQMVSCIISYLYEVESIYLRIYDEDFKQGRAAGMFNGIPEGFIEHLTNKKYNSVIYVSGAWYFAKIENDEVKERSNNVICRRIHILNAGSSYQFPKLEMILFDEFISKGGDYPKLFSDTMTVLSTLIRNKCTVQIFMCGNTVNAHSIFFREMGLKNILLQKQGTIELYYCGPYCLIGTEYCDDAKKVKVNNEIYFPFNNSTTQMITKGYWDLEFYPHCPCDYCYEDIIFTYFIEFEDEIFQCEIINKNNDTFTFIHKKTTPYKNPDEDLIFTLNENSKINYITNFLYPSYPFKNIHTLILNHFKTKKVFYQDNIVGDKINAFIKFNSKKIRD